jgi:hypothetical protein
VSFFSHVGVDVWGLLWVTWVGSVPPVGKKLRCKRSVGGAEVTCVEAMGVYEIGTYMYNGVLCIYMLSQSQILGWCVSRLR